MTPTETTAIAIRVLSPASLRPLRRPGQPIA
jgi:hypothetical protein